MRTHNAGFYEDLTKIIFQLSSNTHLISSAAFCGNLFSKNLGVRVPVTSCVDSDQTVPPWEFPIWIYI